MHRYTVAAIIATLVHAAIGHCHDHKAAQTSAESGTNLELPDRSQAAWPPALLLPTADGPSPWSDKPVLNDPDRFQIAIVTDRTGGHRPGIWMDAVRKLNLLRPEFVMSVGDLIEGYTDDRQQAEKEWREFLGFIDRLDMKFFFVAGNHDVSNPMLHQLWREKFGREWYSFDYRGVHFLCLCSEDPDAQHIGEEQLNFIRADLDQHADARHTLVFLHKPLWTYAERDLAAGNDDRTNWKRVEALLADRPHTVFAGHVHHYVAYERNGGRKYYSLATTGGGSRLRGENYGEFDHVMWLTMEKSGPQVVNLRLDGILPPDIVTEESAARWGEFLAKASIEVAPILLDEDAGFREGDLHLRLTNEFGELVRVEGTLGGLPLQGLSVSPQEISMEVGPTGVAEQSMKIRFEEPIAFSQVSQVNFIAKLRTSGERPLLAERSFPVLIDRKHVLELVSEPPTMDGRLIEWGDLKYRNSDEPLVLGNTQSWQGLSDGSLAFSARRDESNVYFGVRVTDERLAEGDALRLIIDGRPMQWRLQDPRLRRGIGRIRVSAPTPESSLDTNIEGVQMAASPTDAGYEVEIALPVDRLRAQQPEGWQSFQLALQVEDVDDQGGDKAIVLWRGSRSYDRFNTNYGTFVKE